ncbi:hypothetical protein DSLPV1_092 [Dishui lake phycodnavirus 1]|uniref:hypothetical protein n=1 Tax=Dishui lake phycodnavirus 1 TaxID=2079134 RepID=UPI000CD69822|nr:hypothetical protein C5Y57_gp092 [Dishui lake phycodnavirus 1]AUT19063.1 hypothetical protein DSLPV1_092 [Dishui lake phycodnavirus 1]
MDINVLVEAKREYTNQLCLVMIPHLITTFQEMYEEAVRESKNRKPLMMFQKYLKEVPNFSSSMSQKHASEITSRCSWFNDLLAAVFVSSVKILSSVRLRPETGKKISVKVPTEEVFVQSVLNACAKNLYRDPYIYHEQMSEYDRDDILTKRYTTAIEETIKDLLPVQQILSTYMQNDTTSDDREIDLGAEVQDEDPEEVQDEEEEEKAPEPEPVSEATPVPAPPEEPAVPQLQEFKDIHGVPPDEREEEAEQDDFCEPVPQPPVAPTMPTQSMHAPVARPPTPAPSSFFDDAPDARVKKPNYM